MMTSLFATRRLLAAAFCSLALLCGSSLMADELSQLPLKTVNGHTYRVYEVQPRETIYALSKRFGVSTDEIMRLNPRLADGLKAHSSILLPASATADAADAAADAAQPAAPRRHLVSRGETLTGIGKKYGVTTRELFEWNPSARDGIRAGEYIFVSNPAEAAATPAPRNEPAAVPDETVASAAEPGYIDYKVKENETFYSIARAHGITIGQLEKANPTVGVLHTGDLIRIPAQNEPAPAVTTPSPAAEPVAVTPVVGTPEDEPVVDTPAAPEAPAAAADGSVDIAMVLPLMLHSESHAKQTQLYTEFLKGFLIAADSLRNSGATINLAVFDTAGSLDTLRSIMSRPDFTDKRLIVAPDSETHLSVLADYARRNNLMVFNPFVVRDETYLSNRHLMQANIPQSQMYAKAIDGLITRYGHCRPVIVGREEGADDKNSFVSELRTRLRAAGIEFSEISFRDKLQRSELNALPADKPLLVIPVSGRQPEANRILPVLVDFRQDGNDVTVFAYPEWTTFRGETLDNMHAINTVVYSRFQPVTENNLAAERLDGRFVYWYGKQMANVLPRQGLLGFDAGMFLIEAVRTGGVRFGSEMPLYRGIQNSFHFITPQTDSGLMNDVLYFINYRTGNVVESSLL